MSNPAVIKPHEIDPLENQVALKSTGYLVGWRGDLVAGLGMLFWVLLLMICIGPGLHPNPLELPIEASHYLSMAKWNPGSPLIEPNFPAQFRVLSPTIVRAMPFDAVLGFHILALAAFAALAVLLRRLAVNLGLSASHALCLVGLVATLFYPTIYYTRNPFMTDPLFLVFWVAGLILIIRRKPWLVALTIAVGVLNKESILFLTPPAVALWFDRERPVRSVIPAVLAPLPALAIYLGLGSLYGRGATHEARTPTFLLNWIAAVAGDPGFALQIIVGALLAGAPLWLYAIFAMRSEPFLGRRFLLAGAAAVFPLLLLASDSGRQLALFPMFWLPGVVTLWSHWFDRRAFATVLVLGGMSGLLLAAAAIFQLTMWLEIGMRCVGIIVALVPLAMRSRSHWATA